MSSTALEISKMVDMLPEEEQNLAYEFVKRIVRAWDPDFTKVTPDEAKLIAQAEEELKNGEVYSHDEIDWN